jgi:hypothetical protein
MQKYKFCHCERSVAISSSCIANIYGDEVASSYLLAMTSFLFDKTKFLEVINYQRFQYHLLLK